MNRSVCWVIIDPFSTSGIAVRNRGRMQASWGQAAVTVIVCGIVNAHNFTSVTMCDLCENHQLSKVGNTYNG